MADYVFWERPTVSFFFSLEEKNEKNRRLRKTKVSSRRSGNYLNSPRAQLGAQTVNNSDPSLLLDVYPRFF